MSVAVAEPGMKPGRHSERMSRVPLFPMPLWLMPLLALDGKRIVADATLHRRAHGPLRLAGRVKWTIDPEFRGVGLGSLLINHFIDTARGLGLKHLNCMLITDLEADAIRVLAELGFRSYEVPGYGTDPDGNQHDMTLMVFKL